MNRSPKGYGIPLLGLLICSLAFPSVVWSQRGGRAGGGGRAGAIRSSPQRSLPSNYGSMRSSSNASRTPQTGVSTVRRLDPAAGDRLQGAARDGGTWETPRGGQVTGGRTEAGGAWVAGETAGGGQYVHGRTGDGDRFAVGRTADGEVYARAKGDFNGGIVDLPGDSDVVIIGDCRYYRHGYDYYWPYYYGGNVYYQEVYAPTGAVYDTLPTDISTLTIGGQTYYTYDGVYYQEVNGQYVVVDAPVRSGDAPSGGGADAESILKRMDTRVSGMSQFVVDYAETRTLAKGDEPETHQRRIYVRRPDHLAARDLTTGSGRQYVYDGKKVTVFDPARKVYGEVEAPATLAETIAFLRENYGMPVPVGDLLNGDFFEGLSAERATLTAEGRETVGGAECDKIVFETSEVRGTLWVDAKESLALPHKLVLDYFTHPGQPKYELAITRWSEAKTEDNLFAFTPPGDATRINLVPRAGVGAAP